MPEICYLKSQSKMLRFLSWLSPSGGRTMSETQRNRPLWKWTVISFQEHRKISDLNQSGSFHLGWKSELRKSREKCSVFSLSSFSFLTVWGQERIVVLWVTSTCGWSLRLKNSFLRSLIPCCKRFSRTLEHTAGIFQPQVRLKLSRGHWPCEWIHWRLWASNFRSS